MPVLNCISGWCLVTRNRKTQLMVPQSPKNQPRHPPAPTKDTMHVIVLCKMNRRTERRESQRSRDCMLRLGTDGWAAGERTAQPWGSLGRGCCHVLGVSRVKWVDSALEKQDWVNIRLPLLLGDLPGGLRLGPWCSSHFLEAPCQALAHLGPSLTPSSSSSPEVFRNKRSFQEGLHSTCTNTVNTVWRGQGSSGLAPEYYNFPFPFLATLPYFTHSHTLGQSASCRLGFVGVDMPALPKPGIGTCFQIIQAKIFLLPLWHEDVRGFKKKAS